MEKTGFTFNLTIQSAGEESDPSLSFSLFGYGWYWKIPPIIKPDVLKVRGEYNYDELIPRRYGISLLDNFFSVSYGRGDANFHRDSFGNEQCWSCFLPWTEWRFIEHRIYDITGKHIIHSANNTHVKISIRDTIEKCQFIFLDFDTEIIEASTYIEEREWHKGDKWFKWLSFFVKPRIQRTLDIQFSKETGPKKGSWKGGTTGHSIDMYPDETQKDAFKRYCQLHNMTFGRERYWRSYE